MPQCTARHGALRVVDIFTAHDALQINIHSAPHVKYATGSSTTYSYFSSNVSCDFVKKNQLESGRIGRTWQIFGWNRDTAVEFSRIRARTSVGPATVNLKIPANPLWGLKFTIKDRIKFV
jgi:hypothetical protein